MGVEINDLDGEIVNFYCTAVSDFKAHSYEIGKTLHSREQEEWMVVNYTLPENLN